jgi:hypothetical protein
MNTTAHRLPHIAICAATALAAALVASCSSHEFAPTQIQASNPTVTYKYHNDDELVQTNQLASEFCSHYQSMPRAERFTKDSDHDNVVVYECVATSRSNMPNFNPDLTYTYRTDQEILDGSQNAQAYCVNKGSSQVASHIERNNDGTRTVTFQCR